MQKTRFSEYISHLFVAGFATLYVSGYLIDYLYYSSIGIADSASEIFKLKYIQTGLLFFLLLTILCGLPYFTLFSRKRMNAGIAVTNNRFQEITFSTSIMGIIYFMSIYLVLVFLPVQYFHFDVLRTDTPWYRLVALYVLVFVVFILRVWGQRKIAGSYAQNWNHNKYQFRLDVLSVAIIALTILADAVIFCSKYDFLMDLIFPYGFFFIGACTLITMYVNRAVNRLDGMPLNFRTVGFAFLVAVAVVLHFYLALAIFAYYILPFIPSDKGGADYSETRRVSVILQHPVPGAADIMEKTLNDMIILYTSSSSYYLAKISSGNDACDWRTYKAAPRIVQIPRDNIQSIRYSIANHNCVDSTPTCSLP